MPQFLRGAKPTPRHKLLALTPYKVAVAPPPQFTVVPQKLDVWGNSTYGVCVTSEEAFAKAWWSTFCGLPETFISEQEVINWARRYGFLNGATLTEVMDLMAKDGLDANGVDYKDGPYLGVDYSNELILQSALDPADSNGGPVKIAIDADALPAGAGNENGWYSTSGRRYGGTNHCVAISGYGRADYLYDQQKISLPSGLSPSTPGYHLFTWGTIGFVSHDWLMGTCTEAYLRNPTTQGQAPAPTPVPPSPPVPPAPPEHQFCQFPAADVPVSIFGLNIGTAHLPSVHMDVQSHAALQSHPVSLGASSVGLSWLEILAIGRHGLAIWTAIKNDEALKAAVNALLADFGIPPVLMQHRLGALGINYITIAGDVLAIVMAVRNYGPLSAQTAAAVAKLIADLGWSI